MKVYHHISKALGIKNPVVTVGSFDGVHVGHQVILRRLRNLAHEIDGETVLITFHPHPRKVLYPESAGKELLLINSLQEKIISLEESGLDHLIIHPFTKEFSQTSSHDFLINYLIGQLNARVIVVGFNHHFGHNREGDYRYLFDLSKEMGFQVEEIPEQEVQHETVSSTKIRQSLLEGNIQRANAYLDRHYFILGKIHKPAHELVSSKIPGYHLEIDENTKLIPPNGLYAISSQINGMKVKGLACVFNNSHPEPLVYIHFMDKQKNIEGKAISIKFHIRIREKIDKETLMLYFKKDCEKVEEMIF